MTIKELRELVNSLPAEYDDNFVVTYPDFIYGTTKAYLRDVVIDKWGCFSDTFEDVSGSKGEKLVQVLVIS